MDRFHWSQDETGIHPKEIGGPPEDRWLVLYLLLHVRDGDFRVDELAERLVDLGFDGVTPGGLHKIMQQLEQKGLLKEESSVPDGDVSGSGAVSKRYGLTLAGEYYLRFWGDSLEQYGRELGHFLHMYRGGRIARTSPSRMNTHSGRDGQDGAGTVFILTSSGLRHMGLRPGSARPNATRRGFLGHLQEEIFWRDAAELVHEDDLPLLWFLVSLVMEEPGASESIEVRFRDAWGEWVLMDVCVLNVLEAPTSSDTGLLVVNVRQRKESTFWRAEMPNGNKQAPR
jgi:hypothetical protein